ncbi:hypothetical protein BJX61DRAFT_461816 [Aspergillus egyptiacus]|nr:hypothetical protein BJX61DRAFT_461816 [Aspergillus egyptiacus]
MSIVILHELVLWDRVFAEAGLINYWYFGSSDSPWRQFPRIADRSPMQYRDIYFSQNIIRFARRIPSTSDIALVACWSANFRKVVAVINLLSAAIFHLSCRPGSIIILPPHSPLAILLSYSPPRVWSTLGILFLAYPYSGAVFLVLRSLGDCHETTYPPGSKDRLCYLHRSHLCLLRLLLVIHSYFAYIPCVRP